MKLTTLFLLTAISVIHANDTYSQKKKVSLNVNNMEVSKIIEKIETTTDFRFVYNLKSVNLDRAISINAKNEKIEDVLKEIFKGTNTVYKITKTHIVLMAKDEKAVSKNLSSQENTSVNSNLARDRVITGTVTDSKGLPLPGVTVSIKGNNIVGVITNYDGQYSITVPNDKSILTFSFIGFKSHELKITGQTVVNVILTEDVTTLKEVVVTTAYGAERKTKEIGYTVAKIKGEEINRANSGNILNGLIGKVAGLSIANQSSDMSPQMRILLRGVRSFGANSNNQPLFIFNGAPISFGNDQNAASQTMEFINNLNPADIEDVTVLKGANGTALYGPEGVNGVIVITTKKAAKGAPVINFMSNSSIQLVDYRTDFSQKTFGVGSGVVDEFGNGIYDPRGTSSWGPAYDGSLVPIGYPDENGEMQKVTYSHKNDSRKFFNTAFTNRYNLSFSQADVTSSYYLGLGHVSQTGLLPGDNQNQFNALLTSSKKFGNGLKIQTNFNYSRQKSDRGRNIESKIRNMPTFIPLLDYKDWRNGYWANRNRYWQGISPYEELENNRSKATTNSLNGSLAFDINPVDWLTITVRPSINYTSAFQKTTAPPVKYADFVTDPQKFFDSFGSTAELMVTNTAINNDFIISSVNKAGNFMFRTSIGNTIRQNYLKQLQAGALLGGNVYNLDFNIGPINAAEFDVLSRTTSAFGRFSVGYKDMVFFEVTGRNEWDSKRAKVARGKDFYSSANTSLVLEEMLPFLKKVNWLSTARLRASFAQSANMNIFPFQSERTLGLNAGYPYINTDGSSYVFGYSFLPNNNPNPFLKPEKILSQEYGLNFGVKDIFTADLTYYYQLNNSVILNVANAWLSGFPTTDNAGKFENQGWELEFALNPLKLTNDLSFSARVTGAINTNKVLSLTPVYNGLFPLYDPNGVQYFARPGNSAYEFAITDWKRDPQGRVIIDKNTGFPIEADPKEFTIGGNTLPKYSASLALNFSLKRFNASMLFDYVGGYDHMFQTASGFYNGTDPRTTYNNRQPFVFPNSVYLDDAGNYIENTNIVVQNAGQELYSRYSTRNIYGLSSGAFIKFRQFALEYNLPIKSNFLKQMSLSIYGRDLFTIYPKSNVYGDPSLVRGPGYREQNFVSGSVGPQSTTNNSTGGSSDDSALPGTTQFGFSISAKF